MDPYAICALRRPRSARVSTRSVQGLLWSSICFTVFNNSVGGQGSLLIWVFTANIHETHLFPICKTIILPARNNATLVD